MNIPEKPFTNLLEAAKHYRDNCGLIIHPLSGPNEGTEQSRGKKPKLTGWKKLNITDCTDEFLKKHFRGNYPANIGVVINRPHIVIDLDSKKDKGASVYEWLETQTNLKVWPRERTAGGCHIHIQCNDVPLAFLETLGAGKKHTVTVAEGVTAEIFFGGNIVVAPSVHKSGHVYAWEIAGEIPNIAWDDIAGIFLKNEPVSNPTPTKQGRPKKAPSFWASYKGDLKTLNIVELTKHLGIYGQLIDGEEGKHSVRCPWHNQHSDSDTPWTASDSSTAIWEAKPGEFPGFKCLHESHGDKPFKEFLEWAESREPGIVDKFCSQQRIWKDGQLAKNGHKRILLPGIDQPDSKFANAVGQYLGDKKHWFQKAGVIVEVREKPGGGIIFDPLKPAAAVTSLEKYIETGVRVKAEGTGHGQMYEFKPKSMSQQQATILLESQQLKDCLPAIDRVFHVPQPILKKDGSIAIPQKGYDPEFCSYLDPNSPELYEMPLDKAKQWVDELLKEFPFRDTQARTHAIAALLTPFCRGLYTRWTCRTPMFFYEANRERTGKDYLAGNFAIIHEGSDTEDPPISRDGDELRKKITSTLISGRRRMHFANCRGFISSDILENITTSEQWTDRILGHNKEVVFPNELEFSLSANIGIGYTADLDNRSRKIALAFYEEDANKRSFTRPDLKQWTREYRASLLSALMAFVTEWHRQGCLQGPTPFSSFPVWAETVGGIMHACSLGDPCLAHVDAESGVGGDTQTRDMRELFQAIYEKHSEQWITRQAIYDIIQDDEEAEWFAGIDFETRKGTTVFGKLLGAFIGRELGGIRMLWDETEKRARRRKFKFTKQGPNTPKSPLSTLSSSSLATLATSASPNHIDEKNKKHVLEEKNVEEIKSTYNNGGMDVANVAKVATPIWELVTNADCFEAIAEALAKIEDPIALDIETYGQDALNPYRGEIRLLTLAVPGRAPWIIDLQATGYNLGALKGILELAELIIHNARFDLAFLRRHCDLHAQNIICTMTAARLLSAGDRSIDNSLGAALKEYGIIELPKELGGSDWGGMLTDDQYAYAASDVAHLHALWTKLKAELKEAKLEQTWELEAELLPVVVNMEAAGFAVDRERLQAIRDEYVAKAEELSNEVQEVLESGFNTASHQQLKKAFASAGVTLKNTNHETLSAIEHPAAKLILEIRANESVAKQAATLLKAIEHDGDIHAQFDPTGAGTGRFSSKKPNLQNIGRGPLRECFIAGEGRKLICADYSQIELRVAAALASESKMIQAYQNGEDLHKQTAALVLQKDINEITKDERQLAKAVNFGLLYGQSANGLVDYAKKEYSVILQKTEAERIHKRFFSAYKALEKWHAQTRKWASNSL